MNRYGVWLRTRPLPPIKPPTKRDLITAPSLLCSLRNAAETTKIPGRRGRPGSFQLLLFTPGKSSSQRKIHTTETDFYPFSLASVYPGLIKADQSRSKHLECSVFPNTCLNISRLGKSSSLNVCRVSSNCLLLSQSDVGQMANANPTERRAGSAC